MKYEERFHHPTNLIEDEPNTYLSRKYSREQARDIFTHHFQRTIDLEAVRETDVRCRIVCTEDGFKNLWCWTDIQKGASKVWYYNPEEYYLGKE